LPRCADRRAAKGTSACSGSIQNPRGDQPLDHLLRHHDLVPPQPCHPVLRAGGFGLAFAQSRRGPPEGGPVKGRCGNLPVHGCGNLGVLLHAALLPDDTAVSTAAFLRQAVAWFARQGITWRALMTDNGGGYRSHRFQAVRRQLRIRHLWTRPYTPRTNGKAERFIRTCLERGAYAAAYRTSLLRARMLPDWLRYYNRERPHTALGFQTPVQRLRQCQ
jgi:hypothetical protein